MKIAFFFVMQRDPSHYLHACALVRDIETWMPGVPVFQLTDMTSPEVLGVTGVVRRPGAASLLRQRIEHYAGIPSSEDYLLIDTDVAVRADVSSVFHHDRLPFDVAFADRDWAHLPQGDRVLQDMPFNTGVCFTRSASFWFDALTTWNRYPADVRADWMSEQRAVWDVARTGRYRVRVLPGMTYNYPPTSATDFPRGAALVHFKGNRKTWLSDIAYGVMSRP